MAKCFMRRFLRISPLHSYIKKSSPPPSPLWTNPTPEDHDLTKFDSTLSSESFNISLHFSGKICFEKVFKKINLICSDVKIWPPPLQWWLLSWYKFWIYFTSQIVFEKKLFKNSPFMFLCKNLNIPHGDPTLSPGITISTNWNPHNLRKFLYKIQFF